MIFLSLCWCQGTVCTGRTAQQFEDQGTGTGLYIQNGPDPTKNAMKIPKSQDAIKESMWGNGKCFYNMGKLYEL